MKAFLSDGAKERLFRLVIKANDKLETCNTDEEYKAAKKRCAEWSEIVMTLGLSDDLKRYYAEKRGEE